MNTGDMMNTLKADVSQLQADAALRLLVVEDEMAIARDIRENLENCGYQVVGSAMSGEAAVELVRSLHPDLVPDLVLMDIVLSGEMDGVVAAQQIWSQFRIPVVYLTAYGDPQMLARTKATNAFGYVVKPFADNSLRAAVEVALDRYKKERHLQHQTQDAIHQCKTYTAIASHEFRNFLATIQSSADLLQFALSDPDSSSNSSDMKLELIEMIQEAVSGFNEMIDTTLSFAKASDQAYKLDISSVDCVKFCKTLIKSLGAAQQRRVLIFHYEAEIETEIDPNLFTFIFNNLISNALKYSPCDKQIILTLGKQNDECVLRIKDYGIGIPEESQEQIFNPFQRAKNACGIPGTGVGLATVAQCVEWLNGSIELDSQMGQGSTFTVRLPLNHSVRSGI